MRAYRDLHHSRHWRSRRGGRRSR